MEFQEKRKATYKNKVAFLTIIAKTKSKIYTYSTVSVGMISLW